MDDDDKPQPYLMPSVPAYAFVELRELMKEEVDALATTYLTQHIEKPSEFYYCSAACHRSRSTSLA